MQQPKPTFLGRWIFAAALLVAATALACSGSEGPDTDSETHWMERCSEDADCGEDLDCLCGLCTTGCDDECDELTRKCVEVGEQCEEVDDSICLERCEEDEDCPTDLECVDGVCEPEEGLGISENDGTDETQVTFPAWSGGSTPICAAYSSTWYDTCAWVLSSDAIIDGTLEEMTMYARAESGVEPDEPLESCDPTESNEHLLGMTIDVNETLRGDVADTIEVFTIRHHLSWRPRPRCSQEDPTEVDWGSISGLDDDIGPLEVGQPVGMALTETEAGHNILQNPLLTRVDGQLVVQPLSDGTFFNCESWSADEELREMTSAAFDTEISYCGDLDPYEDCELQSEVACRGDDCCPDGCNHLETRIYDTQGECETEDGTVGCAPATLEEGTIEETLFCTPDGELLVDFRNGAPTEEVSELVECTELEEFDGEDDLPEIAQWGSCG